MRRSPSPTRESTQAPHKMISFDFQQASTAVTIAYWSCRAKTDQDWKGKGGRRGIQVINDPPARPGREVSSAGSESFSPNPFLLSTFLASFHACKHVLHSSLVQSIHPSVRPSIHPSFLPVSRPSFLTLASSFSHSFYPCSLTPTLLPSLLPSLPLPSLPACHPDCLPPSILQI